MGRKKKDPGAFDGGGKITFDDLYTEFRQKYPKLKKEVIHWKPYDYLKIKVYLFDGTVLIYHHWGERATVCKENWKRDGFRPSDPNH